VSHSMMHYMIKKEGDHAVRTLRKILILRDVLSEIAAFIEWHVIIKEV